MSMSHSESQTTKTVVVANDIHKAISVYAEESESNIQDIVDDILRGDEPLREDVMRTYNRLEKEQKLPSIA